MGEVLDKFISRLTDAYSKNPGSNVHKLMQLTAEHIQENEDGLKKINDWRDVDQSEGKALNLIGRNVNQNRGQLTDEVYRVMIKAKIKRSLSNGSVDTLIDFLSFVLSIPKEEVEITELWPTKTATINVNVPADAIASTGLSFYQFGRLINLVVIAGVRAEALFEGTFSFSDDYNNGQMDNAAGFADDAQTIGGKMGYVYDPDNQVDLPI